jgi:hypothetical protein
LGRLENKLFVSGEGFDTVDAKHVV